MTKFFHAIFAALAALSECKEHNPNYQAEGRRQGKLGGASPGASTADCAKFLDIKIFEDSPGYHRFIPDKKACKAGPSYVGSTEDGNCHVTLVPSAGKGRGDDDKAFTASVTCDDTGAIYSIGPDGNGTMTVVERAQDDYGPEIDPLDEMTTEERALSFKARVTSPDTHSSTSGLRGKVANQLRDLGDRFLAKNYEDHGSRDLQGSVVIDALVLYTAHAECRNAGLARGCTRTTTTQASMLSRINLAVTETNTAYSLSGVNVVLRLVHVAFDAYVEASVDAFGAALSALQSQTDGNLDQAHSLRTTYGADIVALIIDDAQYCGIGYLGPSINYMFSVTAWNCATGYYSFGHEIGHNFVRLFMTNFQFSKCSNSNGP
ncbi:hypothetical protein ACHAXA_007483 [Cyclostephanos tholiformis]|uniref:Peptidase M12B domain-containing protein n=1 Tax=Cyclostephanos tholiformis TaxID=382380 RepID=A0ABD3RTQ4_9STRA